MNRMEQDMANLQQKHVEQDKAKQETANSLKEHIKSNGEKDLQLLMSNLQKLQIDMMKENYIDLNDTFERIKKQITDFGDAQFVALIQDKLDAIDIGLKDREATKFNNATKAVREIKELLQQM